MSRSRKRTLNENQPVLLGVPGMSTAASYKFTYLLRPPHRISTYSKCHLWTTP